jgi:hypothetical protein
MFLDNILKTINEKKIRRDKRLTELKKFTFYVEDLHDCGKVSDCDYQKILKDINVSKEFLFAVTIPVRQVI